MARRLQHMGVRGYERGFAYTEHPDRLTIPLRWKRSRKVFVNSMSDLFHEDATYAFIKRTFETMIAADWHVFQVLTKRPNKAAVWTRRMCEEIGIPRLPAHIHMGTSIEDNRVIWRLGHLLRVPATVRFLSIEPMIGPVDLPVRSGRCSLCGGTGMLGRFPHGACPDCGGHGRHVRIADAEYADAYRGIDWVIVGGESGAGARRMDPAWVRSVRDSCAAAAVPFFMKQAGAVLAREWGCTDRAGGNMDDWPEEFRIRQYPTTDSAHASEDRVAQATEQLA